MSLFRRLFPTLRQKVEENPREYLDKYLIKMLPKFSHIEVKTSDIDYSIWITNGWIDWRDNIEEKRVREACNYRFVKNPDGSIKTTMMRPFGGEFGHAPREYPIIRCDAIQLGIRGLRPLKIAPQILIDTLMSDLDGYIKNKKVIKRLN